VSDMHTIAHINHVYPWHCGAVTGYETTNEKGVNCPDCLALKPMEMCGHHAEIFHEILKEYHRSIEKHGLWDYLSDGQQRSAIVEEFTEWNDAYYSCDIHGEHGEIRELIQLCNVAILWQNPLLTIRS